MAAADIKVTEILYDPIQKGNPKDVWHEWVEIQNTGPTNVDLTGWTLDDSRTTNTSVGTFTGVVLQPGQIAILYNANITQADLALDFPNIPASTVLIPVTSWQALNNSNGDTVNLIDNTGTTIVSLAYADTAAPGQSLHYPPNGAASVGAPDPGVTCFTAGSLIDTETGSRLIESLQPGLRIRTLDHGLQTLHWIGRRLVLPQEQARFPALCPIEIEKHALGAHMPARRTRVSPWHRLLVSDTSFSAFFDQPRLLCAAKSLVGRAGVRQTLPGDTVEYLHIVFDRHEVVFVDGQPSESFFPDGSGLAALSPLARTELFTLFPELESAAMPLAYPVMSHAEAALLTH